MFKKDKLSHFETIFKLTIVIIAITVVFFLPFYWYYKYQGQGIAMYLVLIVFTSPFIKYTFKDFIYFKKNEISNAFLNLNTLLAFLFILNVIAFIYFGLKTLINIWILIGLYVLNYFPVIINRIKKQKSNFAEVLFTLTISAFLIVNFQFSSNPKIEEYEFFSKRERSKGGNRKTTLIVLEENKYEQYVGMRTFLDISEIKGYHITYTIKEGFFGLEVVDSYKFNY
ncbi:hypothetical protein [Flavobacterium sp.]|jgi:hypothetical protein|uniref:hypothetical protein n=1 Tax=Flavobacterium sp. TaxID=239 RepID=UPI002A810FB6|nr:hypothetical protein [Flavobacterium sp.]